jgi:4-hydroxy-tetrahydrodipicolinate reductase
MTRIIMSGCNGAMGRMICDIVSEDEEAEIVAGIDIAEDGNKPFPVFKSIADCDVEADAVIDFSTPKILEDLLQYSMDKKVPVVLCTTGYTEEQLAKIEAAAEKTAVLKSANMSLGINTLLKLVQDAAKVFAQEGFDVEIVEKHHNQKLDAPSGTALALADSVNEAMGNPYEYVYDRSQRREKRNKKELGISAVRGGTIVGEHDVIFAGKDEVITFSHTAYSKAVFGKGAVSAAKFLKGKESGRYDMADVIAANE